MIPTKIRVVLALLALAACKDKAPEIVSMADAMPNVPMPPQATVVAREGSVDAIKLTLMSTAGTAEVEAYYSQVLSRNGWKVINDSRDREGARVLLARQGGPPLWVRIKSTSDSTATMVELAGAVLPRRDSAPAS